MKKIYNISVATGGETPEKSLLGKLRNRWENNIKICLT
jgi:hypothetical protein